MKKIARILTCLDFSDYSLETLEYAVALAPREAKIVVISVINSRDLAAVQSVRAHFPDPNIVEKFIEGNREARQEELRKMIDEHFREIADRFTSIISVGVPFEEILTTIERENIDLVVMGSKGRGNIARTLFGSNAEKVFRHSPVPVLSVRHGQHVGRKRTQL